MIEKASRLSTAMPIVLDERGMSLAPYFEFDAPPPERLRVAKQIAVLVDQRCASSCEQFLLYLRQGSAVTLIGSHSAGMLDYSNVAFFMLPSHDRVLALPTTRSKRLPKEPIDGIGVAPDVVLDWGECSDTCHWVIALRAFRQRLASRAGASRQSD